MPGSSAPDSLPHLTPAQIIALACVLALVALVPFLFRRVEKRFQAGMEGPRRKADELYRRTEVPAEDPRHAFSGATAEILKDEEMPTNYNGGEYALTRYARNPEGEYFMLMFEVNRGIPKLVLTKCMEHHIARYVLGDKYREPLL